MRHLGGDVATMVAAVQQRGRPGVTPPMRAILDFCLSFFVPMRYDYAVTTVYGFNTPQSDPYLLRRIEVDVDQHWLLLAAKASGVWGFFSCLYRRFITRICKRAKGRNA